MSNTSIPLVSRDSFYEAVYAELKRIARYHLKTVANAATLSTTDVVHEAYLKLAKSDARGWDSRGHFFASAARAMRQVLVDYARQRYAGKRGGGRPVMTLTGGDAALEVQFDELLVLDEALDRLQTLNERMFRVVELRFFAGLNEQEIAELLQVSSRTVERDWVKARLYLSRELGHSQE